MELEDALLAVRKPDGPLLEGLEAAYREAAERFGYTLVQSPLFLMFQKSGAGGLAIEVQFGSPAEFDSSLRALTQSGAELCVFVTSSRVRTMRLEDARALLLRKFQIKTQRYLFIDIETGRSARANFEWNKFEREVDRPDWSRAGPAQPSKPLFRSSTMGRSKPIYGKRGEHKEQD
ncbi:Uncharacterised protein [uncultured archaeon]|nr:Uncharacterised protein [uncultured archaeon]